MEPDDEISSVDQTEDYRLECWVTLSGETSCIQCGGERTGSRPVSLLPPRTCAFCRKDIKDKWPLKDSATTVE